MTASGSLTTSSFLKLIKKNQCGIQQRDILQTGKKNMHIAYRAKWRGIVALVHILLSAILIVHKTLKRITCKAFVSQVKKNYAINITIEFSANKVMLHCIRH
jgi:hypothetical protein